MKDYSFGDREYQKRFILRSNISEDHKYIIVYYASGEIHKFPYTYEMFQKIEERKKEQIQKAYEVVHSSTIDYGNVKFIEYIKRYIAIKLKAKDIDKNKVFLDSLEYMNKALRDISWLDKIPIHLQEYFLWDSARRNVVLDDADYFSLKDVNIIVSTIKKHTKVYS